MAPYQRFWYKTAFTTLVREPIRMRTVPFFVYTTRKGGRKIALALSSSTGVHCFGGKRPVVGFGKVLLGIGYQKSFVRSTGEQVQED